MVASLYHLMIYIYKRDKSIFLTTMLEYLFLLGKLSYDSLEWSYGGIKCYLLCTSWLFIFIIEKI